MTTTERKRHFSKWCLRNNKKIGRGKDLSLYIKMHPETKYDVRG